MNFKPTDHAFISEIVSPSASSGKLRTSAISVRANTVEPAPMSVTFTRLRIV